MADQLRGSRRNNMQLEDFQVQGVLGQGSYGFVLLACRNHEEFALKEMSKYRLKKYHNEHVALVEKELLKKMQHPGVVAAHGAFQTHSKLYIVLELCRGGDFLEYSRRGMSEKAKRFYFAELVNIIEYLHLNGIIHRDLKPANLLLSQEGHLKMVDFGTACVEKCSLLSATFKESLSGMKGNQQKDLQESPKIRKRRSTFVGTSQYMSPELIERNECNAASDIWTLGCILYFIYYGNGPFYDRCELVQFNNIRTCNYSFPENEPVAEDVKDLISKLLLLTPEERLGSCSREELSFKALKNHPFFKDMDVDTVFSSVPPDFVNPEKEIDVKLESLNKSIPAQLTNEKMIFYFGKRLRNTYKSYRCQFFSDLTMKEYDLENEQYLPIIYSIEADSLCQVLCPNKLLLKIKNTEGEPKLIYRTTLAQSHCQMLNQFLQSNHQPYLQQPSPL